MGAKFVVLGAAAAAAFSSAVGAAPCMETSLTKHTAGGFDCTVNDKTVSGVADASPDDVAADRIVDVSMELIANVAGDDDLRDGGAFSSDGVKITNLQAAMTSNTYVARDWMLAPAAQSAVTEDLTMYGPDYLSTKWLPRVQKRPSSLVGVGLVTAPSHTEKTSHTAPSTGRPRLSTP